MAEARLDPADRGYLERVEARAEALRREHLDEVMLTHQAGLAEQSPRELFDRWRRRRAARLTVAQREQRLREALDDVARARGDAAADVRRGGPDADSARSYLAMPFDDAVAFEIAQRASDEFAEELYELLNEGERDRYWANLAAEERRWDHARRRHGVVSSTRRTGGGSHRRAPRARPSSRRRTASRSASGSDGPSDPDSPSVSGAESLTAIARLRRAERTQVPDHRDGRGAGRMQPPRRRA